MVALGRTDSDLDDVWSEEPTGDNAELTEFDFSPPGKRAPPKKKPSLTSDLEVPALGMPPPVIPPLPTTKSASLEIGSVLVGASTSSLLDDVRADRTEPEQKDARTMMADAESAAIAHVVSRSLSAGDAPRLNVPDVLERSEVQRVLMGRREEGKPVGITPPPPPVEPAEAIEPEAEAALELAFDPRQVPKPLLPQRSFVAPPRPRPAPVKSILLVLLAIVAIAAAVRLLVYG